MRRSKVKSPISERKHFSPQDSLNNLTSTSPNRSRIITNRMLRSISKMFISALSACWISSLAYERKSRTIFRSANSMQWQANGAIVDWLSQVRHPKIHKACNPLTRGSNETKLKKKKTFSASCAINLDRTKQCVIVQIVGVEKTYFYFDFFFKFLFVYILCVWSGNFWTRLKLSCFMQSAMSRKTWQMTNFNRDMLDGGQSTFVHTAKKNIFRLRHHAIFVFFFSISHTHDDHLSK